MKSQNTRAIPRIFCPLSPLCPFGPFTLLALVFLPTLAQAQISPEIENRVQTILDDTLWSGDRIRVPVLLLGTFHFKDAGLDDFKPQHEIDVKSPERQKEIEDLVNRLAEFKPTKIAVERTFEARDALQSRYDAYRAGE